MLGHHVTVKLRKRGMLGHHVTVKPRKRGMFVGIIVFYFENIFQMINTFYNKQFQTLFIDQLAWSKATCPFMDKVKPVAMYMYINLIAISENTQDNHYCMKTRHWDHKLIKLKTPLPKKFPDGFKYF